MKLIPLLLFACFFQITFAQSYQGKWKLQNNFGDTTFLEITSDSMFFHEVLDDCYSTLSFNYADLGNDTLNINTITESVPTHYYLTNNDSILVLSSEFDTDTFQLYSFDITQFAPCQAYWACLNGSWIECTYNWKCNSTVCEDVGLNNGTFNSESDCQASCTADTSGSDTTSINEYDLNVSIYPNPFIDYTTLSLSSNVVRYQLIDLTGRLVYDKLVENQVEYLHKNQLKSGVYMLHLIGEKGSNFERLLIE